MSGETLSEVELLQASARGDTNAFEIIVKRYQSLICAITFSATGDVERSEELAQETFVSAWKDIGQLQNLDKFRAWLASIARNVIKNFFRRQKREAIGKTTLLHQTEDSESSDSGPVQAAITKEQQAVVREALRQIPQAYRVPLVLYYRQQQSVKQVAQQLELSEEAVRQRLFRGRKFLKEQVAAMVEETISRTEPGSAFATAVVASIAGMLAKGSGAAAAATVAAAASSAGTVIKTVMSGTAAKIVAAAAVAVIGVGAIVVYKQSTGSTHNSDLTELPDAMQQVQTVQADRTVVEGDAVPRATATEIESSADGAKGGSENIFESASMPAPKEPIQADAAEYQFKPKGVLSGLITDKDTGEPVVGAQIVVYGVSMPNGKLVTDLNGFYSLEKIDASKPYEIVIRSKEYVGKPDIDDDYKIPIEKDKQKTVHFQLSKACMAELWVKDEQGKPIKGAEIEVVDLLTNRSTAASRSDTIERTDKDGYTLIGGLPAAKAGYMVMITHEARTGKSITSSEGHTYRERKPDFAPAHIILKNTDPDIAPVFDVIMKKGKPIKGHIEYADGVPASDLKIVAEPLWWSKTNLSGPRTDVAPYGSFTLSHVTPQQYRISAYYPVKRSYKPIETIDFAQYDGELHFALSEPSPQSLLSIKGTVKVIKKAPVGNLYINIRSYNTTTNTHGSSTAVWSYDDHDEAKFEINRLKEGNYRLTFQSEHFQEVVLEDIQPPVDDLYIEMEQVVKPEIVAMVLDKATGKAVTSMRARLIKTASRLGSSYGVSEQWLERSNPQGRAVFTVTPGVYQVQVMAEGYSLGVSEEIDTEDLMPVTVELTKGGSIRGRLINSAGEPIAGAEVLALSYAGGNRVSNRSEFITKTNVAASDANGNFILEHLPEGLETIKAEHKDYSPAIVSDITVIDGTVSEEILIELEAGAIVEGHVFDNNGNPIAGTRIDCDQDRERVITGESTKFAVTDPNGYYRIEGLGENSYFIARNRGSFTEGVVCRTITPVCAELTRLDFGGDGQIVTGTVVLDDIPSANLKLALRGNTFGQFLCYTTTDADGNFVFTGVIEGEYNIRPVGGFDTMLTSVDVVDTDIDLGVIGNNLVDFEVVIEAHEDWNELQYVAITVPPTSVLGRQRDESDKQNRLWRFVKTVPGQYDLRIMNKKAASFTTEVDIAEEQTEALTIKPPRLEATLTGRFFRSMSRKPMPRFLLLINDTKTFSAYLVPAKDGVPDANGQFEVKLPGGQFQIRHIDGKDSSLLKEFEIISGQHIQLEIDLDSPLE